MEKLDVSYVRVSTEAQTEKYGIDLQKQKITEYCEKNGINIDRWYVDGGYSGSKLDRPEMQKLLKDAERGEIGRVFIYKLDRLSRDTVDTLNLLNNILPKYGVHIISMVEEIRTENPMDKVMVTMNAAMSQYEREVIYMRTRAGMVERVKKGLWTGGGRVPWGYYYDRNDGILHPDKKKAEQVRKMYQMYINGYSCDKIARMFGIKFDRMVMQILMCKINIGLIEYKGEVYHGKHEPIVDEETFYKAQECMKKRHTNSHLSNKNMLTGLCYCGVCGARMKYQKWGKYHAIVCYSRQKSKMYMVKDPNCDNAKPKAYEIEEIVEKNFKEFAVNAKESEKNKSNSEFIKLEIRKSNSKIKKMYNAYFEHESEHIMELIKEEEARLKELKKQLESEKEKEHKRDGNAINKIRKVADMWDDMRIDDKNKMLKDCIERIVITYDRVDVYFIDF